LNTIGLQPHYIAKIVGIAHTSKKPSPHAKPQAGRAADASLEVASIEVMDMERGFKMMILCPNKSKGEEG